MFPYNKRHYFAHPHKFIEGIYLNLKWAWQRVFRGWDDRVVWCIDGYLFEMLPIWLRRLKEDKHGVPLWCFEAVDARYNENHEWNNGDFDKAEQHFNFVIDKMIEGFEAGCKDSQSDLDVYDDFVKWQIEKYGREFEWSLDDNSNYSKAYKEFDVYGKTTKEVELLRIKLDIALGLFAEYHGSLWD